MKYGKQDFTAVMAAFTEKVSKESTDGAQLTSENLELLNKFVNFLETEKPGKGHHGKHRFMFGHGFGKHDHHHGRHGPYHGKHGHHHGPHHHFGKHHHGGHGKHGRFGGHKHGGKHFAHWATTNEMPTDCIDLTCDTAENVPVINQEIIGQLLAHIGRHGRRHCGHRCQRNGVSVTEVPESTPPVVSQVPQAERNDPQDLAEEVRSITIQDPKSG